MDACVPNVLRKSKIESVNTVVMGLMERHGKDI